MLRVYIDDQEVQPPLPTLRAAIDEARQRAENAGRLVIEVHADGAPISNELLTSPPDDTASVDELRFVTTEPGPFIRVTLLDAADSLRQVKADQDKAAEALQAGNIDHAFVALQGVLNGWAIVREVVEKSGTLAGFDPAEVRLPSGEPGKVLIDGLAGRLGELRDSLSNQDWSGLSDLLAYELDGHCERWAQFLQALADKAHPAD